MKFLDLFEGIGGFRLGMESAGHECIGFCEIDKFARASYKRFITQKEKLNYMILQESQTMKSELLEKLTSFAEAFHAKPSLLPEQEEDLKILEELSSLKSHGLQVFLNPSIFFLKTSKDSSTTTEETPSKQSSERLMDWGMMSNGKCLTAKISESLKTGSECSLSDILEDSVPETFFLSEEKLKTLILD